MFVLNKKKKKNLKEKGNNVIICKNFIWVFLFFYNYVGVVYVLLVFIN
jgi:hypothetical protein